MISVLPHSANTECLMISYVGQRVLPVKLEVKVEGWW